MPDSLAACIAAATTIDQRWREAVAEQAAALRRVGQPGYPSPEAACRIIADDLDRMADEGV